MGEVNERRINKFGEAKCRNCAEPPMPGRASCEYHLLLDQESGVKRRREVSDFLKEHGYGTPHQSVPVISNGKNTISLMLGDQRVEFGTVQDDGSFVPSESMNNHAEAESIKIAKKSTIEAHKRYDRAVLERERAEKRFAEEQKRLEELEGRIAEMQNTLRAMGREDLIPERPAKDGRCGVTI